MINSIGSKLYHENNLNLKFYFNISVNLKFTDFQI